MTSSSSSSSCSSKSSPLNSSSSTTILHTFIILLVLGSSSATLTTGFYKTTCPDVFNVIRSGVKAAIAKEKRMGASLLRLHFHDCFVQGCDASILLDDTSTFQGEQTATANNNSIRGLDVIDAIKVKVEAICPGVVSCADILTIASRDSVAILGGPSWEVKVGRRDSKSASFKVANSGVLPGPSSTLSNLIQTFADVGLSTKDMVVLSGAHTIGLARCATFRDRIYNETNIDPSFAAARKANCPATAPAGANNLASLDVKTPAFFDNSYFTNLLKKKGLLHSDQILFSGVSTDSLVKSYSRNPKAFFADFIAAMIRMGDINPLTGSKGEIRKFCGRPN